MNDWLPDSTHADLDRFLRSYGIQHFTAKEICHRGVPHRSIWPHIIPTLRYAEVLRRTFGPCTVNCGYRDPEHNSDVGGARKSLHLNFNALDITFERGTPGEWAQAAYDLGLSTFGGVGEYSTFLHIDTRFLMFGRLCAIWRQ